MALRFFDSFAHYATAGILLKWSANSENATIAATSGRWGGQAMSFPNSYYSGTLVKNLDAQSTWIMGGAFNFSALGASYGGNFGTFMAMLDTGTPQCELRFTSAGTLQVTRNGTVLGTTTVSVGAGVYNYIEWKIFISATVGTVDVQINGVNVLSLTGLNTKNSTNATANQITVQQNGNYTVPNFTLSDFYVCDGTGSAPQNTFLGDVRADAFHPTANGTNSAFTNDAGTSTNNYSHVSETLQDGDTSYVQDSTVGATDTYAITGITLSPVTIFGVQTNLIARKDNAGLRALAPVIYRGGTAYPGTGLALSLGYVDQMQVFALDPATSAAWLKANVNASEYGQQVST